MLASRQQLEGRRLRRALEVSSRGTFTIESAEVASVTLVRGSAA